MHFSALPIYSRVTIGSMDTTHVQLQISARGLDTLKQVADQMQQGAALLASAHALLGSLRESGELTLTGDIPLVDRHGEAPAPAVVD